MELVKHPTITVQEQIAISDSANCASLLTSVGGLVLDKAINKVSYLLLEITSNQ
jgi:hypothetical protein